MFGSKDIKGEKKGLFGARYVNREDTQVLVCHKVKVTELGVAYLLCHPPLLSFFSYNCAMHMFVYDKRHTKNEDNGKR